MAVYRVHGFCDQHMFANVEARSSYDAKRYVMEYFEDQKTDLFVNSDTDSWHVERILHGIEFVIQGASDDANL